MTHVVEHLPRKAEALNSNPSITKKKFFNVGLHPEKSPSSITSFSME
jgi:hypothetical protein